MTASLALCIRLIERRVTALQMLASSLREATAAISAWDVNSLHGALTHVEHVATELGYLEEEAARKMAGMAAESSVRNPSQEECLAILAAKAKAEGESEEDARKTMRLIAELRVSYHEARNRGREFEALLRRTRRSVSVLMNFHGMRFTTDGTGTIGQLARPPLQVKV